MNQNNKRVIKKRVYIDIGSHGKIFEFYAGHVADRYPNLLHVFSKKVSNSLIPATISYSFPKKHVKKTKQ